MRSEMLDVERHLRLQQAIFFEARLLDEERFEEWLAMLVPDIRYRLPLSVRRFRQDRSAAAPLGEGFIFDDDINRLRLRVERLQSGYVWAEDPRNHVRRIVSNIEITPASVNSEADVHAIITIHRNRIDGQERRLTAARHDRWRESPEGWRLAARDILLDHTTVPDSNLNVFF